MEQQEALNQASFDTAHWRFHKSFPWRCTPPMQRQGITHVRVFQLSRFYSGADIAIRAACYFCPQ